MDLCWTLGPCPNSAPPHSDPQLRTRRTVLGLAGATEGGEAAVQYRPTTQRLGPVHPPPRRRSNHRLGSLECPSSRGRRWLNV